MRKTVTYSSIESANIRCAIKKSKMQKLFSTEMHSVSKFFVISWTFINKRYQSSKK
jgi:hypothetical protein